jgi:alpha-galactosidase
MEMRSLQPPDMPGDKIAVSETHIMKADVLFPQLLEMVQRACERVVVSVFGGSGTGKSEIAVLVAAYMKEHGIGAYALSGDNYPHRIPMHNDAERLRIYNEAGDDGLRGYLGSAKEIDFDEINGIIQRFKSGEDKISLKRMGREEGQLWYDAVDFSDTQVLIIEWTHGGSDHLQGVDIPVLLWSTPAETLAHRRARGRDKGVDSPFTARVLEIEGELLHTQAHKARLILSSAGELISELPGTML